MHLVIYTLVEASTADDAMAEARVVFDRLVGTEPQSCPVFDYYVTVDDTESTVAEPARWGDLPTAAPVDSAAGSELLEQGWDATTTEF